MRIGEGSGGRPGPGPPPRPGEWPRRRRDAAPVGLSPRREEVAPVGLSPRREEAAPVGLSLSTRATDRLLAALAVTASLALLPWLGKSPFPDEKASLRCARLGWSALWQHSRGVDLVLLPYYALLHVWADLSGGGIEWARLLSLMSFGLTVFLVGRLGARLGGRSCGLVAAILAATSPLLVAAGLNARPYALSSVAATLSVIALVRWLESGEVGWMWWFSLWAVATLLLQLFAVLVPLSALIAACALRPVMFRRGWRAVVAPVGLMVAASLSPAVLAAGQRGQIAWIPSLFAGRQPLDALIGPASGAHALYAVVVLSVAAVAAALSLRERRRGGPPGPGADAGLLPIFLAWAALPTAILVAASLVRPVYVDRYVTASVPGLALGVALLTAHAYDATAPAWASKPRPIIGAALLGIAAVTIWIACAMPAAEALYPGPPLGGRP